MEPRSCRTALLAIMICMALPAWGQQYLQYVPQPAPAGQKGPLQDGGILVREIEIRKGDTLYALSRKFSGHGMYFPQILLFNDIKNPNLIYTGDTLRIPISQADAHDVSTNDIKPKSGVSKNTLRKTDAPSAAQKSMPDSPVSASSTELSIRDLDNATSKSRKPVAHSKKILSSKPQVTPPARKNSVAATNTADRQLFESAVKAFKREEYRSALELFDRYLATHSASPLAADANLYKAECYLKLSAQ